MTSGSNRRQDSAERKRGGLFKNPINRPSEMHETKSPSWQPAGTGVVEGNLTTDRHDHARGGEVGQSGTVVLACSVTGYDRQSKWEGGGLERKGGRERRSRRTEKKEDEQNRRVSKREREKTTPEWDGEGG